MGHSGLALATSIAMGIATILLFYGLRKKLGPIGILSYIKCGLKAGLAAAIMGVVAYVVYHGLNAVLGISMLYKLISLIAAVGLAVIVYGVLCYVLRIEEIRDVVGKFKERLFKR